MTCSHEDKVKTWNKVIMAVPTFPQRLGMSSLNKIKRDRPVIIYCQTGKRASAIIYMLEKEYKLENLYNLEGGYNAVMQEEYESI